MRLIEEILGSAIPMVANVALLLYICQRFLAATRQRRKLMKEMREFATIVHRARDNIRYIGEQVTNGMEQIKEDVGKELRVTDRLTTQSVKLGTVLERFASLEENVIELVRMDRNRESVRIETPVNVTEEIERIVAAAVAVTPGRSKQQQQKGGESSKESSAIREDVDLEATLAPPPRLPLSKFSACNPRESSTVASGQKTKIDGRARVITTPEVRLLGETK
ncbi:hypothetical protein ANTRET_LOCUS6250 [Anthophora retusa]